MSGQQDSGPRRMGVVVIEQAEIMVIMLEEVFGQRRPPGMTALEALAHASLPAGPPEVVDRFKASLSNAATRIMDYVIGEIENGVPGTKSSVVGGGPMGTLQ